jgi:hypothetical protein
LVTVVDATGLVIVLDRTEFVGCWE